MLPFVSKNQIMKNKLFFSLFGYLVVKASNKNLVDFNTVRQEAQFKKTFIYGEDFLKLGYQDCFDCNEVLEEIFGSDFKYTNGFVVQFNHHGVNTSKKMKQPVFHIDSDYDWFRGHQFVKKLNNLAKIGVYGQSYKTRDNVLAIPFSHLIFRIPWWFFGSEIGKIALRLVNFFARYELFKKCMRVPLEEGDILIFDCLLLHASDDGGTQSKVVIYNEVGSREGVRLHQIFNVYGRAIEENAVNQLEFIKDPYRYRTQVQMYFNPNLIQYLCANHFSHAIHD